MQALDRAVFHAINRWPESWTPFFYFLSECTKWNPIRLTLVGLFLSLIAYSKTRKAALCAVIAFPIANEACDLLKAGMQGVRPSVAEPDVILRVERLTSFGTASAHSANMASIAFVFTYCLGWKWGLFWILIAFFTGLSRIYVGVHYPYQVLLGWTVGTLIGLVVTKTADWITHRREAPAAAS